MSDSHSGITRLVGSSHPTHKRVPVSLDVLDFGNAWSSEAHFHKVSHQILFVLSGEIEINVESSRKTIKAGATAEIPAKTPHSVSTREGAKVLVFSAPERDSEDTFVYRP